MTKEHDPAQKSEGVVKMSLIKSGDIGGFQFSKVKLNTVKCNSTDYYERIIPSKVKDIPAPTISTSSFPDLDILTLTIPFICLFLVSVTICLLNILKTSLSSTLNEQTHIIEPSSAVAAHGHDVDSVSDSEFMYLSHA